jgi:hypothetical protein
MLKTINNYRDKTCYKHDKKMCHVHEKDAAISSGGFCSLDCARGLPEGCC